MKCNEDTMALLSPVALNEFLHHSWQKQPLCLNRDDSSHLRHIFSFEDFDQLLATVDWRYPNLRVYCDGNLVPPGEYAHDWSYGGVTFTSVVRVGDVLQLYRRGASLVLQSLEQISDKVQAFCAGIEQELCSPTHANAFLTPEGGAGVAPHSDNVDVFVLQLQGRRQWNVSAPGAGSNGSPNRLSFVLDPGDTLYIPKGWMHAGKVLCGPSLHISLVVHAWTYGDLVLNTLRNVFDELSSDPMLRCGLPISNEGGLVIGKDDIRLVADALSRIKALMTVDRAVSVIKTHFSATSIRQCKGRLLDILSLADLTLESQLETRDDVTYELSEGESEIILAFWEREVVLPRRLRLAVHYLLNRERFRIKELPGLIDDDSRIRLAKRLIATGFLRISRE